MEKFIVSRDDSIYEAWPDLALTGSGALVCAFAECTHHRDRSYTRMMFTRSTDRGRTWSPKQPLTVPLRGDPHQDPWWNCPRVSTLSDGRLVAVVDRIRRAHRTEPGREESNWLWFSEDEGLTWDGPHATPIVGIVPDQLIELKCEPHAGRWILDAQTVDAGPGGEELWLQRCWSSDDRGETWDGPYVIASVPGLQLCEGSVLELPGGELVCFMRENSGRGLDVFKSISLDGGHTWEGPYEMPIPGCHRPVAGMLQSGKVLITHRFLQGGRGGFGWGTQNFFGALTDVESCLARTREEAHTRILPIDFDRSPHSDLGYSGWVQFPDGEIYVVNYIMDDAPKGQIRGYSLTERDFLFEDVS